MPILNLFVHVWLYLYFALHDMGVRVWWKRYLTLMQVTQFYLTFVPSIIALAPRVLFTIDPALPLAHACHGSWTGVFGGLPLLASYLFLFQRLYKKTYDASGTRALKRAKAAKQADAVVADCGESAKFDHCKLRSETMWGRDSVPYWRRPAALKVSN